MRGLIKFLISGGIILVAVGICVVKYWDYVVNPWTRDGQVRALVIQITPRVTALIVNLPIQDNKRLINHFGGTTTRGCGLNK